MGGIDVTITTGRTQALSWYNLIWAADSSPDDEKEACRKLDIF